MRSLEVRVWNKDHEENGKEVVIETKQPGEHPGGIEHNAGGGRRFYYVWWCLPDGSESRIYKSKKEVRTLNEEMRLRDIVEESVKFTANTDLELIAIPRNPDPTLADLKLVATLKKPTIGSKTFYIRPDGLNNRTLLVTFRHSTENLTPNNP